MKYEVPFKEEHLKYLDKFKDLKIISKNGDIVWVELELKRTSDIINLFFAGVSWGVQIKS